MATAETKLERTEEDVLSLVSYSNISQNTLVQPVQVLYFSNEPKTNILLELDHILFKTIESGQTLHFLGNNKDKLILCTESETYDVRRAENSNSTLAISGLNLPDQFENCSTTFIKKEICSVHHSYLEVRRIKPDIGKIRTILEENLYRGPELEPNKISAETKFYTTNDLLEVVQISEGEALEVLKDIDALRIQGYWRLLSFEYQFRGLSHLINFIDENSWSYCSIPMYETLNVMKELLPDFIAEHIFFSFCEPSSEVISGEQMFELNERKVCRFLAMALLSHAKKFNLDDFMNAWSQGVPEGMAVNLSMIEDMVIIEKKFDSTESIFYFPEYKLSGNINDRFKQLFEAKTMWNYDEIEPFLRKLSTEKQDVKSILTKHTRTSKVDSVVYYFSKYGK